MQINVKVYPHSKQQKIVKIDNNPLYSLKCYVISPKEKNKANNELIELLSKFFKINKNNIHIISGQKYSLKTIQIDENK